MDTHITSPLANNGKGNKNHRKASKKQTIIPSWLAARRTTLQHEINSEQSRRGHRRSKLNISTQGRLRMLRLPIILVLLVVSIVIVSSILIIDNNSANSVTGKSYTALKKGGQASVTPAGNDSSSVSTPNGGLASNSCTIRSRGTEVLSVTKDNSLMSQWNDYANSGIGWTGGDSVHGYSIGHGSTLWTFADSFLGPINSNGTRPFMAPLVHNLFVVQHGSKYHLKIDGNVNQPFPLVSPHNPQNFYLALSGAVEGRRLQEFLMEIHRNKNGGFHWQQVKTVVATFMLPSLKLIGVTPIHQPNLSIQWGAYVMNLGSYTYIYGATATSTTQKKMYVARVTSHNLNSQWKYFDGSGWTVNASKAAGIYNGVSEQFSITPYDGIYIIIDSSVSNKFSARVDVLTGCTPEGPFYQVSSFVASYRVGPLGQSEFHSSKVWVYEAMDQPSLNRGSQFLVSYNRNSLDYWDLFHSTAIYRPGYLWVTIGVGIKSKGVGNP